MPVGWRLVKSMHAATAFGGEGAARTGGRWNSYGRHVVYTSSSRSLAVLENLVHLDFPVAFQFVLFRLEFSEALVTTLPAKALPRDWRTDPPAGAAQKLGDQWLAEGRFSILAVPSAIVPEEINYLLNPAHADFAKIKIAAPEPFALDSRLRDK